MNTSAFAPSRWIALVALWVLLAGCSSFSPLSSDHAIGTLPVPDPATDCQVRVTRANVAGGGLAVQGGAQTEITSIIGAANCPAGLGVPTVVQVNPAGQAAPAPAGTDDILRRLEAIELKVNNQ